MCHIPNGFRDRAIWMYNRKIVDKKEILRVRTVSNSLRVTHRNAKFRIGARLLPLHKQFHHVFISQYQKTYYSKHCM